MTLKVIFLNGPAGSGKDTIGNALSFNLSNLGYKVKTDKFAQPIKDMAQALLGLTLCEARNLFETPEGKATSFTLMDPDYVSNRLNGWAGNTYTFRDLLIELSEDFIKPRMGNNAFGKLLVSRNKREAQVNKIDYLIITDCGFRDEIFPVVLEAGAENCFVFRLQREGTTFKGDSRGYVYFEDIFNKDLDNNRDIKQVVSDILLEIK